MMKENNNVEILLMDAANKLREARTVATNVPSELHDFADYLASGVGDHEVAPMEMMNLLIRASDDLRKENCGFANKVPFPEELKKEKFQIIMSLEYFPLIVDKIASKEFAEEFRKIFDEVLGKALRTLSV